MRARAEKRGPSEAGAALLIAIFALMLISVVAIALVVSTGTDSALAGNYRSASGAYYASLAGLEEARGRLLWKNPDFINKAGTYSNILYDNLGVLPQWGLTTVVYITNPSTVDPTNLSGPYPDNEYLKEFNIPITSATVYQISSVSALTSIQGPSYKWVRITPVTEQSIGVDVNGSGLPLETVALYYDPAHVDASNNPMPSLLAPTIPGVPPTPTSVQALEITAYAVLPSGGTRLLQYVVAPVIISPDLVDTKFPAALTLDDGLAGSAVTFSPLPGYVINGSDACTPPPATSSVASIGYTSVADQTYLQTQANLTPSNYPGIPFSPPTYAPTTPSLINTTSSSPALLRQSWLTPKALDAAMQDIVSSADVVLGTPGTIGNFNGQDIWNAAPGMSVTNPMTIVVNGNLTLNGSLGFGPAGYGLLLVTGNLDLHPSAGWNGIVLVVGQGGTLTLGGHHGSGGIAGAVFVAQTRNSSGALLPSLISTVNLSGGSGAGTGISYNSCWIYGPSTPVIPPIGGARGPLSYKILSFREIPTS